MPQHPQVIFSFACSVAQAEQAVDCRLDVQRALLAADRFWDQDEMRTNVLGQPRILPDT
jgi:hypothetical protein